MARADFTLAAALVAAVPGASAVAARSLTEHRDGRIETALIVLDDGTRLVAREPRDAESADRLRTQQRILEALTEGVRDVLPFRAPRAMGEVLRGDRTVYIVDALEGYRVDATEVPRGAGMATALGEAIAAVHGLPTSVVREQGLPVRTAGQIRDESGRLIERAIATGHVPRSLRTRWASALDADDLWLFEPTVSLGGVDAEAFVFADRDEIPTVIGLLDWNGLCVGDPAADLAWTLSAPTAIDDVWDAYAAALPQSAGTLSRERSRLYAELEFAKWLLHGLEVGDDDIVADAASLLAALDDSTRGEDLSPLSHSDVDEAIDVLEHIPPVDDASRAESIALLTDSYERLDPDEEFAADAHVDDAAEQGGAEQGETPGNDGRADTRAQEMQPLEPLPTLRDDTAASGAPSLPGPDEIDDPEQETQQAFQTALRRWGKEWSKD